jgi:hypothetical protein
MATAAARVRLSRLCILRLYLLWVRRCEPGVGIIMNASAELSERLRQHAKAFLEKARTVRTTLQVAAIAATSLAAVLKLVPSERLTPFGQGGVVTAQFALLVVAAGAGLLVLLTEKSASAVMADAQDMKEAADLALEREHALQRLVDQLQAELSKAGRLSLTIESMRVPIDVALSPEAPGPVERQIGEMLDLLVVSKATLFGINDELWNFSVYLWCEDRGELQCVACRRPSRADEDAPHRSWRPGEGHIGKAFQMRRALICADSTDPNVRGFFDAPEDKRAAYDDRDRYRSLAAIPFRLPGAGGADRRRRGDQQYCRPVPADARRQ